MENLKERVVVLEKLVLTMVSVEKISRKDLTKEQKNLLDETLEDVMNKRHDRFLSFEDARKRIFRHAGNKVSVQFKKRVGS